MNSGNSFNVPTLSLSSFRSKKNQGVSVPTHDHSQKSSTYISNNLSNTEADNNFVSTITSNVYKKSQKNLRPPIFPPRPNNSQMNEQKNQFNGDGNAKDLNKNVYLQRREDYFVANTYEERPPPPMRKNSSLKSLLTNPLSSRVVQQQMNERNLTRKSEISKVLFDRKILKLLQEINIYDAQLLSLNKDELSEHVSELQQIKKNNIESHKQLLQSLNALIS